MPRSWRALPLTKSPGISAKAPSYNEYLDQLHDMEHRGGFYLPRVPDEELPIAEAIMKAIPDIKAMKIEKGQEFTVWRHPFGLSVRGPSGWIFQIPFDVPKKGKGAGAGGSTASGEPEPAKPVRAKRTKANS